jgi:hypothetical protein
VTDRYLPVLSVAVGSHVAPMWPRLIRSRLIADAFGAPVLRDQGPIGRPGTPRPIIAAASSLSGTSAGCVHAACAGDVQLIRILELAVVVRSAPDLTL